MIPSKSKRNKSRRSSILKPRKPRQPLQNVNLDSSFNENSPTVSKVKRRVSFAEKKHVKEFCHSIEQGTVWDNTYEEHDFSLKGSFVVDQDAEVKSKENASLCTFSNNCARVHSESNLFHPNDVSLVNSRQFQESIVKSNEEDDDTNCDLDFINPIKFTKLSNISRLGYAALPNMFYASKDAVSSITVARSNTDEECVELHDKESESRQTVITNISCTSKNVQSSSVTIYRDSDEENCADNVANKYYSKSYSNNVNSKLNKTHVQDLSMELTTPVPAFLSAHLHVQEQTEQKHNNINNLSTNYTNCNNVSMEITETVPIFAKSVVSSDLRIVKQIPAILQNCENIYTKWDAASGTDVNCANDSMVLTSVIEPFTNVADTGTYRTNNTTFDTSMKMISVPSEMYNKNICNENIDKENDLKKNQTDKTEIFNDALIEMAKPVSTILSSRVYNKQYFGIEEPVSRDDRTMFFHDVSMEITEIASMKNKQEIADTDTCKLLSEENTHGGKDVNVSVNFNERTRALCKSMEFIEAIPASLCNEKISHVAQSANKNTCEDHTNDRTKFFNDASMEITKSLNISSLNVDKENLKINKSISKDDETMLFYNVPMEMTTVILSRSRNEITQPIMCKSISKENVEKDTNNSTCFNEKTKLLCKSMEFTEVAPIFLYDEKTFNTTHTKQSTLSKTNSFPAENFAGVEFRTNNDKFQHPITDNNSTEFNTSTMKENFTVSREIVETENIRHQELSNVVVDTQSPLDDLNYFLNTDFESASGKKRISDAKGKSHPKRICSSLEVQSSQENDTHSFPSADANYVNDTEHNECFVKDIMGHAQLSDSKLESEIGEHSFVRKSLPYLENSLVDLQSITPPFFPSPPRLNSKEENSFNEIQYKLQLPITINVSVNNISNQLIINNVTKSKSLNEELINIENNQMKDCHKSIIVDTAEDNQEISCQTITKAIINDNLSNKSNYYTTKNINELSVNAKNGKALTVQDINHCTSLIIKQTEVTNEDQVDERESVRTINEAKLQKDIKKREQYSDKKRQTSKKCGDHLGGAEEVIEDQTESEEYEKNLSDEVKQSMEQKDECATKRLVIAQCVSTIEDAKNESLTEQNPFLTLSQELETHATREDCIWNVYHKDIDKKMIVFGFISNSLLIGIFLSYDFSGSKENLIKEIRVISRISDDTGVLIRIVHKLILEIINTETLITLYRNHQDILTMLNFISQNVKLTMDFMFDLRRLDDLNLMEITHDEISFVSRSKRMDIILRVVIKVKQFDKITSDDVSLHCLLGRVKETDIKNLIKNVKRDHKFLRRYMNDVKDYIDIIEETYK